MDIKNVQVVAQLLIIDVWNQQSQKKYHTCITRENFKKNMSYVDFQDFVRLY